MKLPISIFIKRLKWSDYVYLAMTVFLGMLVVDAKFDFGKATTWIYCVSFAVASYFSGEIIYKALRSNNTKSNCLDVELESTDFEACIEIYTKKISNDPHDVDNYLKRGYSYHLLGSNENAIKDFNKVIAQSPENTIALTKRGECMEQLNEGDAAIEDYLRVSTIQPGVASTWQRIGNIHRKMGRLGEAINAYTKRIEIHGDDDAGYIIRGDSYLDLKDYKSAARDFTIAIEKNPNNIECIYARAYASIQLQDYKTAEEDLSNCIEACPENRTYYELRALVRRDLGDIDGCRNDRNYAKCISGTEKLVSGDLEGAFGDWTEAAILGSLEAERLLDENKHLRADAMNYGEGKKVQEDISFIEKKPRALVTQDDLLYPSENLEEWRNAQVLLSRNAAYIQRYENYIEALELGDTGEIFKELKSKLQAEYLDHLRISSKYKDAYYLFRLRNLTYATMAVNMNGESLEDRESFMKYFLHSIFDVTDTILRETLSEDEIQKQFDRANELEQYIAYGCSIYCNKLLNLIDGSKREERDKGESFDKFLEIQSSIESKKMVDEIYVVREAMIWTIASTNVDLVTSAQDSDVFEVKAFEILSKTNMYGFDYGNGPHRKEDIIKALCKRIEWERLIFQVTEGISTSDYLEKLLAMTDEGISAEAIGKESPLDMREFLNRWGQASQVEYGINDLRQAVINDYAYLCYQDGGTQPDEASLQEYKKNVEAMNLDELMSETSVIETSEFKIDEVIDYMELWLKYSKYADYDYESTKEDGTILGEGNGGD